MQRALDRPFVPVGIDLTLAQEPTPVRALVVDGEERAIDVHQSQLDPADLNHGRGARRHLLDPSNLDEAAHRMPSSSCSPRTRLSGSETTESLVRLAFELLV